MSLVELVEKGADPKEVAKKYFNQWYNIKDTEKGFEFEREGKRWDVQLVIDDKVQDTSRFYVELWSVKELGRYGWAWTSSADMLVYFALPDTLYIAKPEEIRKEIPYWQPVFGSVEVKRKGGYHGVGIPVAEDCFSDICTSVRRLD